MKLVLGSRVAGRFGIRFDPCPSPFGRSGTATAALGTTIMIASASEGDALSDSRFAQWMRLLKLVLTVLMLVVSLLKLLSGLA